jgi:CRP-like cAMP-binding protein
MKTFPWKEFLRKHPIFATLHDDKRIDALLEEEVSTERFYAKGDVIVRQGDVGNSIFIMGSGTAEAVLELGGGASISLAVMRRGEMFGEMALLERRARSATVRATEPCTVLEFRGADFEQLMADYPDIEFRLLLKMSERLRNANEQVMGLQGTLDEKLNIFNLKLDTEQRLVDVTLKAAQTMFDQTKLRADEVISSAERSRGRLQWAATVIGGFITIVVGVLGFVGAKQIYDINQIKNETASIRDGAKTASSEIEKQVLNIKEIVKTITQSQDNIREAVEAGQAAKAAIEPLKADMIAATNGLNEAKESVSYVVARTLFDAVDQRSAKSAIVANQSYSTLKGLNVAVDMQELLFQLDKVVTSALPPKVDDATQQAYGSFAFLLQQVANDAPGSKEKVKAYYLLLVYAIATNNERVPEVPGKYPERSRQDVYAELQNFLKSHHEAKLPKTEISDDLRQRSGLLTGSLSRELQSLNQLAIKS